MKLSLVAAALLIGLGFACATATPKPEAHWDVARWDDHDAGVWLK